MQPHQHFHNACFMKRLHRNTTLMRSSLTLVGSITLLCTILNARLWNWTKTHSVECQLIHPIPGYFAWSSKTDEASQQIKTLIPPFVQEGSVIPLKETNYLHWSWRKFKTKIVYWYLCWHSVKIWVYWWKKFSLLLMKVVEEWWSSYAEVRV